MNNGAESDELRGELAYATAEMRRLQAEVDKLRNDLEHANTETTRLQVLADLARAETQYLRKKLKEF